MKLHRFTEEGVNRFGQFLEALGEQSTLPVPSDLLTDPVCATAVAPALEVHAEHFGSRMELARYLEPLLSSVTDGDALRDVGLWAWLSLFWFDQVCPPSDDGSRKVRDRARYIPATTNYQKYYRHLLAGPYRVYRAHRAEPDRALVLLCGPIAKPGEIVEQLVSRQEIITNPQAVQVATAIYFDPVTKSFKRGAGGKGKGSARRFADLLNQFDVTWDLYWMPSADILAKLPTEFDRFR